MRGQPLEILWNTRARGTSRYSITRRVQRLDGGSPDPAEACISSTKKVRTAESALRCWIAVIFRTSGRPWQSHAVEPQAGKPSCCREPEPWFGIDAYICSKMNTPYPAIFLEINFCGCRERGHSQPLDDNPRGQYLERSGGVDRGGKVAGCRFASPSGEGCGSLDASPEWQNATAARQCFLPAYFSRTILAKERQADRSFIAIKASIVFRYHLVESLKSTVSGSL